MSDISQGGGFDFGNQNQPTGNEGNDGPGSDSLSGDFLKNIPDNDRAVVEKYVKDWDAGVTRRFQEIHNQYQPYKTLGDVEALQEAMQVMQILENNPKYVYDQLATALQEQGILPNPQQQQQLPQQQGFQNQPQQQQTQLPPELQQMLNPLLSPLQEQQAQQYKLLEQLANVVMTGNEQARAAQEDKQLDDYLASLHQKHGNFDEEAVLIKIMNGKDGDTAIQEWKNQVTEFAKGLGFSQFQGPNPPPSLSGGSVPSGNTGVAEMESKDVKDLVANIMAQTHAQGN